MNEIDRFLYSHIERIIRSTNNNPAKTIDLLLKFKVENRIRLIEESHTELEPGFIINNAIILNRARRDRPQTTHKTTYKTDTNAGTVSLRKH